MGTICVTFLLIRKNKKLLMERSFIETGPRKQSCTWLLVKWIDGFSVISIFLQRFLLWQVSGIDHLNKASRGGTIQNISRNNFLTIVSYIKSSKFSNSKHD